MWLLGWYLSTVPDVFPVFLPSQIMMNARTQCVRMVSV